MARITSEDCLEKVRNRFALVLMAAKRTKQLLAGGRLMIENTDNKSVVNSLREIADGAVRPMTAEDRAVIVEKERLQREALLAQAAANAHARPVISEGPPPSFNLNVTDDDDDDDDDDVEFEASANGHGRNGAHDAPTE